MGKRRVGVVLPVPAPLRHEVDGLRRAMGDRSLERIPAHLTLVPPVNVRDERLPEALNVLREAAAVTKPIAVTLGPPTTFLPVTPVLYLQIGGDSAGVHAVHRFRDLVFREPLARPLTYPFVPHVTIADEAHPGRIEAAIESLADWRADVTFYSVQLLEEGPGRVWTSIADVALDGSAIAGRGGREIELTTSEQLDTDARAFAAREWAAFDEEHFGAAAGPEVPFVITARHLGMVVGFASGEILASGVAHLSELLVAQGERGLGIGSRLVASVEDLARQRGSTRITLHTEAGSRAEVFYVGRGWVEEAKLPLYNFGRDFVRLARSV